MANRDSNFGSQKNRKIDSKLTIEKKTAHFVTCIKSIVVMCYYFHVNDVYGSICLEQNKKKLHRNRIFHAKIILMFK